MPTPSQPVASITCHVMLQLVSSLFLVNTVYKTYFIRLVKLQQELRWFRDYSYSAEVGFALLTQRSPRFESYDRRSRFSANRNIDQGFQWQDCFIEGGRHSNP